MHKLSSLFVLCLLICAAPLVGAQSDNNPPPGKTEEEKQLVQRYVAKLAQGEDQLERLRREEKKLQEDRNALQRQLDERIRKLALEYRVS